jgi:hypothetical protein
MEHHSDSQVFTLKKTRSEFTQHEIHINKKLIVTPEGGGKEEYEKLRSKYEEQCVEVQKLKQIQRVLS